MSYLKSEWDFDDYPIETWKNHSTEQNDVEFGARFSNWSGLFAYGNTKYQAIENLKIQFIDYKKNHQELPRPGANVPFEFVENVRIQNYESIAVDFFDKIIGIGFYNCYISDLTSLHEFDLDLEPTLKKIESEYGITPIDSDLFLADIFELIHNKKSSS
ncbi:hypothetical protein [Psychroserpens algicola]|uniref:hypothetical protein n=1 Tax=Psychroserpens algicola TaxID=1719034 RepID=UPI001953528C|nr:hypothetical protein [Psychroserpens algicola]